MAELTVELFDEKMDSFAKIAKEGFDGVDERFKKVDERFDVIVSITQSQFADVKEEFRKVNGRIDSLSANVDAFLQLHRKLDIELVAMRDKYNRVAKAHNALAAITAPAADVRV